MAWKDSPGTEILEGSSTLVEVRYRGMFVNGSYVMTGSETRTRTITNYKNINMSLSGAQTFATANLDLKPRISRQNDAGAYYVETTVDTSTAWVPVV
jgi:hypothetical protein